MSMSDDVCEQLQERIGDRCHFRERLPFNGFERTYELLVGFKRTNIMAGAGVALDYQASHGSVDRLVEVLAREVEGSRRGFPRVYIETFACRGDDGLVALDVRVVEQQQSVT